MAKEKREDNQDMQQLTEQMEHKDKGGYIELIDKVKELPDEAQKNFSYIAQGFIAGALCGK